eukprot:COSAG01_NODE_6074_length_3867_cov_5.623938_2_plen_93_part_00
MYFAECFNLRQRVIQGDGKLTDSNHWRRRLGRSIDDPRKGKLTCAGDLHFIEFLYFVGDMIVENRKADDMKRAAKGRWVGKIGEKAPPSHHW